ncbi:NAD-dependent formate dehydrogenase catalytic subunit [Anaerovirgula multivorans]|uniref:NAD-dependent formate dehydrogenase catalytic subunit n=1 Tax=Anaerovirgula multivorans TaxID=312168 RepID=A0A239ARM1_9FIRM|nr:formate dehydrogenase subunit alpha [Anaerovirgula multivorans]SNR97593.1 NAD-dependent formate dehydrogenase catalytic subunit [Anaerovirgula multivorans]
MINVKINGRSVQVEEGTSILQAASKIGITIPTFCNEPRLKPDGACRICTVEVEGNIKLPTACTTPAGEGMSIWTESPSVVEARKEILNLLLSKHPMDCLTCAKSGFCALQDLCFKYEIKEPAYIAPTTRQPIDDSNPFYYSEAAKCISCGRCVRVCNELQSTNAISMIERGVSTKVSPPFGMSLAESECISCGNCVSVCPVGALMPKAKEKFRYWETKATRTTCSYCGVGCQLELLVKENKIVDIKPAHGESNEGLLCVKGKFAYNFVNHPDRLKKPLIRKNGKLEEATWEEAYEIILNKIREVKEQFGADAIAGFSSARVSNEENYLMSKFMRAVIGTNNVDHCARLCHASTVAGLAVTLGSGAMTNGIADVKHADAIFITGSNTTEAHPVMGAFVHQARKNGAKLIVADPREIPLAKEADVYLQIKPGSSVALSNAMIHVILQEGLEDEEYITNNTEGFEEVATVVKKYTPEYAAKICEVDPEDIRKAARLYASCNAASIIYSMGITQHVNGTENVMSLSNLALVTGNLGKSGAGVNPLRGQNNVQGACDMGALPVVFTGYQPVTNPDIVAKFEKAWGSKLSDKAGLTVTQAIPAAEHGEVKLLYIMGENPMISDPDTNHVRKALEKVFLVVQDIFLTETAELADVILPAAAFAEKDGTFVNTERRVQRIRKAVDAPGESKPDWMILTEIMNQLDYACSYNSPEEIFEEIRSVTPSYAGITYKRIDKEGISWPCPTEDHPGTPILHIGKPTRGTGLFKAVEWVESPELSNKEYPHILTTGRILYHFHTKTMTDKTDGINVVAPHNYIEIHPTLAKEKNIKDGDLVKATSPRGEIQVIARVTDIVDENVVFIPFHWGDGANVLTNGEVLDPYCKIPGFKVSGVKIEKLA